MRVVRIPKESWHSLAEKAHLIVFNETKKPEMDRIDYALVVESDAGIPMQYATCREHDSESVYFQYGGSFPGTKGSPKSLRCMEKIMEWAEFAGYKRISFLVENTNEAMLKLALRCGFLITGIRNYKGRVLLEHIKEFPTLALNHGQDCPESVHG
jgi:RimJ/RimL family protein N-acetyltransferase